MQRAQHAFHFDDVDIDALIAFRHEKAKITRQKKLIFQLRAEPKAICTNLANSAWVRPQPSARLVPIDEAARRIWLDKPNISDRGKPSVKR